MLWGCTDMVAAVSQAAAGQEALEKKVGMLETHQKEIHDALMSMENEAARLYQVCCCPALTPEVAPRSAIIAMWQLSLSEDSHRSHPAMNEAGK